MGSRAAHDMGCRVAHVEEQQKELAEPSIHSKSLQLCKVIQSCVFKLLASESCPASEYVHTGVIIFPKDHHDKHGSPALHKLVTEELNIPFVNADAVWMPDALGTVPNCQNTVLGWFRAQNRMDGNKEEGSSSEDKQPIPTAHEIGESSSQAEKALQILRELREETSSMRGRQMQVSPDQGQFLAMLVQLMGAKQCIEVGVYTGYSSLAVALVLPECGHLVCCERDQVSLDVAQKYFGRAGVLQKWYQSTADFSSMGSPILNFSAAAMASSEGQLNPSTAPMASGEGQSNPSTSGDAGGDHNEDYGNEYGPPLPTQEELREMEHRRLVGEAKNMMLNFAKDPKLAKYMTKTAFQDVHAQWKATTTSPPKPDSKKQYSEIELEEEVHVYLGMAIDTLNMLLSKGQANSYDFAFLDADKKLYRDYYELLLQLVRPGGLVVIDNVLWHGKVADSQETDTKTESLRRFNEFVKLDTRVDVSMVPVGDGMTLCRKRCS
ncbi:hypothetical protein L7F22_047502 [Adiantum nelumboides]|nr:hypothetical protein [Adiantum nelumboides]